VLRVPELDRVTRVDLGDVVTAKVREMILDGTAVPGERLVEATLAEAFGTSRGPVRDALARLELAGLVSINPRRGAFVTTLSSRDIDELYSLRSALEVLAVERATSRVTADDIDDMASALERLAQAMSTGDIREVGESDMHFHRRIVVCAGHQRLASAWEVFADQTLLLMQDLSQTRPDVQDSSTWHGKILDALSTRDTAKATELMRGHLAAARESMLVRLTQPSVNTD
jgi:DNA-binding GntR family transcriptional regulator